MDGWMDGWAEWWNHQGRLDRTRQERRDVELKGWVGGGGRGWARYLIPWQRDDEVVETL